jgi:tetratricopeptide (TPR) repeat protein
MVLAAVLVFSANLTLAADAAKAPTEADLQISLQHQTRGNDLDEQGNATEAIKEYEEALKYDPSDTNTLFNMGTVYLKINKPEEAAKAFESVVKKDKEDTEAYNLLGLAYRGCGKVNDAIKTWEKSLKINPEQSMPKKFIDEAKSM